MAETLDISLQSRFAWLQIHRELVPGPGRAPIAPLMRSRPHFRGDGALMGGIGRFGFTLEGVRFGFGVGVVTVSGLDFLHTPYEDGISADVGGVWGVPLEGYLGYTIGDPEEVRGFFELRGAFTMLQTSVNVQHEALGSLGDTHLLAYLGSLEVRAGVRIPIDKNFFVETGIGVSPLPNHIAPERGSFFFGVGLPVQTSHAF